MANDSLSILCDAIARNLAIVLSLPSAGMLRHHKSRLLAQDENSLWIESIKDDRPLIQELVQTQASVGISFRSGTQKVSFTTPILKLPAEFKVSEQMTVEAIAIGRPQDIKAVQRRNNYRVRAPRDGELRARVWRIPEHVYFKDKPMAAQELVVQIVDLSVGGVGIQVQPKNDEPPRVSQDERVRITLQHQSNEQLVLEGRIRLRPGAVLSAEGLRCGIQFKKLENDLEGRQNIATLTQIVGELQREEVRRMRLGLNVA